MKNPSMGELAYWQGNLLPAALQLVGRRLEDEEVLGIVDHIISSIGLLFVEYPRV